MFPLSCPTILVESELVIKNMGTSYTSTHDENCNLKYSSIKNQRSTGKD
jgi:hypothetical protein